MFQVALESTVNPSALGQLYQSDTEGRNGLYTGTQEYGKEVVMFEVVQSFKTFTQQLSSDIVRHLKAATDELRSNLS